MKIKTNIVELADATMFLARNNISLEVHRGLSCFEMAQRNKPEIIIHSDKDQCNLASLEYPDIKFVGPGAKENLAFDWTPKHGVDTELLDATKLHTIHSHCSFVNLKNEENKLFIKRIECIGLPINVWGSGFGISQINDTQGIPNKGTVYKNSKICASDNPGDCFKILYLEKPCITNYDMAYCNNIYKITDFKEISLFKDQKKFAESNHWRFIFKEFFDTLGMKRTGEKIR